MKYRPSMAITTLEGFIEVSNGSAEGTATRENARAASNGARRVRAAKSRWATASKHPKRPRATTTWSRSRPAAAFGRTLRDVFRGSF